MHAMATAALIVPSPELGGSQSSETESMTMLDWQATLSLSRRSCIKLSNIEPCVNKAVAHLTSLKACLMDCSQDQSPPSAALHRPQSLSDTPVAVYEDSTESRGKLDSAHGQLIIEGVTTGITVEKPSKSTTKTVRT